MHTDSVQIYGKIEKLQMEKRLALCLRIGTMEMTDKVYGFN